MDNALKISVPIWILLVIMAVMLTMFSGWQHSAKRYMEQESSLQGTSQLHTNQLLLGHTYPQILAQNQRIALGSSFEMKDHVRAIDHQDGDISDQLLFYGKVNTEKRGVYTIRCVVCNSLGLKSVKHIQVLVD